MCLYADPKATAKLLARAPTIRAWKVLIRYGRAGSLASLYRRDFVWEPGVNCSNSRATKPRKQFSDVSRGIHVFLRRDSAVVRASNGASFRIVPITCETTDLIAASGHQAVFTKVHLSKQTYNRALKPC